MEANTFNPTTWKGVAEAGASPSLRGPLSEFPSSQRYTEKTFVEIQPQKKRDKFCQRTAK